MKVLALIGSYRKKGNTARIIELIAAELHARAAAAGEELEFETVYLGEQNIGFCRGCRVCFDRGEERCPLKDDLLPLKARLQAADAILAATPVYVDDASGMMKNWIDRMAHLCHRPGLPGKPVYLVATTGTTPTQRALDTLNTAFSTWGCAIIGQAGFVAGALMPQNELAASFEKRCQAVAAAIFKAARRPAAFSPALRSLVTFGVQQKAWRKHSKDDSVDAQYWRGSGWLAEGCEYYAPHGAGWPKRILARLMTAAIAPFMLRK